GVLCKMPKNPSFLKDLRVCFCAICAKHSILSPGDCRNRRQTCACRVRAAPRGAPARPRPKRRPTADDRRLPAAHPAHSRFGEPASRLFHGCGVCPRGRPCMLRATAPAAIDAEEWRREPAPSPAREGCSTLRLRCEMRGWLSTPGQRSLTATAPSKLYLQRELKAPSV